MSVAQETNPTHAGSDTRLLYPIFDIAGISPIRVPTPTVWFPIIAALNAENEAELMV